MIDLGDMLKRITFSSYPCKRVVRKIARDVINKERLNYILMHECYPLWSVDDELEERYPKHSSVDTRDV